MYFGEHLAVRVGKQFREMRSIALFGFIHRSPGESTIVVSIWRVRSVSRSESWTVGAVKCRGPCAFRAAAGALMLAMRTLEQHGVTSVSSPETPGSDPASLTPQFPRSVRCRLRSYCQHYGGSRDMAHPALECFLPTSSPQLVHT